MKVEIINPNQVKELMTIWGKTSCICYNTDEKYADKVSVSVLDSEHFSGSRGQYIYFKIEDVPRSLIDQAVRHDVGVAKSVQSFRYVNMNNFTYYTSPIIKNIAEANAVYDRVMSYIKDGYAEIVEILEKNGIVGEVANQSARGVLPLNTNSKFVIAFTIESLINFVGKRLCVRSEEHIRKLAKLMVEKVIISLPQVRSKLVAQCDAKLYCPEGNKMCCGRYLTREKMIELLSDKEVVEKIKKLKRNEEL